MVALFVVCLHNDAMEKVLSEIAQFVERLPEPVKLVVYGDPAGTRDEQDAMRLGQSMADRFEILHYEQRPRQEDYPYYPIIAFLRLSDGEEIDYGVRIIGLPAGYQINSVIGVIQAHAFQAQNLEPLTRIQLSRLPKKADIEVFCSADNEASTLVATLAAGLAVASPKVRAFIIMADVFAQATLRYSIHHLPHSVINGKIHVEGTVDEAELMKRLAMAM